MLCWKKESRLSHRALVGVVMCQRAGLGTFQTPWYEVSKREEKQRLIQEEVRRGSNDPFCKNFSGVSFYFKRNSHPLVATVFTQRG